MDTVRVLRVIEYVGPRDKIEIQVANSLQGEKRLPNGVIIRAATITPFPEYLDSAGVVPVAEFGDYKRQAGEIALEVKA